MRNRMVNHVGNSESAYPYILPTAEDNSVINAIARGETGPFSNNSLNSHISSIKTKTEINQKFISRDSIRLSVNSRGRVPSTHSGRPMDSYS